MSGDCFCCGEVAQAGGGVAAVAAMVGVGIFIWLNIVAIITILLLVLASIVGLAVIGVGGTLFLQKHMIASGTRSDIAARLRHYANTGEVTSPSVIIEGEVIDDDGEAMESALEEGYRRRGRAISARAHEAAITHPGISIGRGDEGVRPEPRSIRDWIRGPLDSPDQDRRLQ